MDALKKAIGGGNHGASGNTTTPNAPGGAAAGGQKDDYGDKGAAYVNKNYLGGKLSHGQLEKATDAGREAFEKSTGKNVPAKFSN
ncbi:hypothetical protein F4802DRAFT_600608 [Xylaria palmicola]|nr:hypothetical protein F4802DRAFT_600608 [Xylaria palmicola]